MAGPTGRAITRVKSAATTNAANIKASAGTVFSVIATNTAAYDVFLKFYDIATSPNLASDTPVVTINVKAGTTFVLPNGGGLRFSTGISRAITKAAADTDTTALVAGDLLLTIEWA